MTPGSRALMIVTVLIVKIADFDPIISRDKGQEPANYLF